MLTPLTPTIRLAHAIGERATEVQIIARLVDLAAHLAGSALPDGDRQLFENYRDDSEAVLRGARAMLGDLVEELGKLEDRALALQDAPRAPSGPRMPAAA